MARSPRLQCRVDDCDNPSCAQQLCFKHYRRWQRYGTTDEQQKPTGCAVEGCDGKYRSKGYCEYHYSRWLRTGSPDAPPERPVECVHEGCAGSVVGWQMCESHYRAWRTAARDDPCQIAGCRNKVRARGWCRKHYWRWKEHGSAEWLPQPPEANSYESAHGRIRNMLGRAANHQCVDCGQRAHEWSYDHADPDERINDRKGLSYGLPYSLDAAHYHPRCRPCHRTLDGNWKRLAGRVVA